MKEAVRAAVVHLAAGLCAWDATMAVIAPRSRAAFSAFFRRGGI